LTNLLKFIKGYVVIRLSGYAPERFFNLCSRHQIVLWGIKSSGMDYEMCVSIGGFRRLRPLVRKTRTKVVILERHGLPFVLFRYRHRKLFAVGAISGLVLLYLLSLFIWNIHVEGNLSLSDQVILDYLEEEQIVHGMAKKDVHGEQIEEKLREHFPEITWTSAEVKGTRLIIHIQENEDVVLETIPKDEPADLVAADSGMIVSMIVRSGTPKVFVGMEVKKGDLLVSSRVEILNDAGQVSNRYYVHADADILIQKKETYRNSFSMQYEKKVYTGRKKTSLFLMLGNRRLDFGLPGQKFEQADNITSEIPLKITENFYLPLVFGKNMAQEYLPAQAIYSKEEATMRAKEELSLYFEKLSAKGLQIMENNVKIDTNEEQCTAFGDYIVEKPAGQERAPNVKIKNKQEFDEEREEE